MPTPLSTRALVALALLLGACSSEDGKRTTEPDAGSDSEEDAGVEPGPDDAAATPDATAASDSVPLTVWVDDLIDHRTSDQAEPDTVEDKKIEDDTDETSFDKYLQ
jgi:hypothetical protein